MLIWTVFEKSLSSGIEILYLNHRSTKEIFATHLYGLKCLTTPHIIVKHPVYVSGFMTLFHKICLIHV